MRCTNCGVELEEGARFCQDCGTPVPGTGAKPRTTTAPIRPVDAAEASGRHKVSRPVAALATLACIAAIVALVAGIVHIMGGHTSSVSSESPKASESAEEPSPSATSQEAAEEEPSASSEDAAEPSEGAEPAFIQADAEEQARKDAIAAGMQVFPGTIRFTTYGQRVAEVNPRLSSDFRSVADRELVLLMFSMSETVSAAAAGDMGRIQTRAGQECLALSNVEEWRQYDGQLVTVAAYPEDLVFPSDVAGSLYSAIGGGVLIAPLTQESAAALEFPHSPIPMLVVPDQHESEQKASSSAASAKTGDYMLPDSATHKYTKSELAQYSDYELFIARNEIYARHGRKFQSDELNRYFSSKSWYNGTTPAASFDESVLNNVELANSSLILEVEQSRGSKYLQ